MINKKLSFFMTFLDPQIHTETTTMSALKLTLMVKGGFFSTGSLLFSIAIEQYTGVAILSILEIIVMNLKTICMSIEQFLSGNLNTTVNIIDILGYIKPIIIQMKHLGWIINNTVLPYIRVRHPLLAPKAEMLMNSISYFLQELICLCRTLEARAGLPFTFPIDR